MRTASVGDFKKGKLPVLISTLMGEGVDIPNLSHIINCRGEESAISVIQLLGRAMRTDPNNPNKKRAICVDIADRYERWLGSHAESRQAVYETEKAYIQHTVNNLTDLKHKLETL
jgi:superfamily II DNA or RNA helicase